MFSTCPVGDTAQPNPFLGAVQLRYLPTLVPSVQVEAYGAADAKNLEQLSLEIHPLGDTPWKMNGWNLQITRFFSKENVDLPNLQFFRVFSGWMNHPGWMRSDKGIYTQ